MEMRAQVLMGLERWLEKSCMTQAEAAKVLGENVIPPGTEVRSLGILRTADKM